MNKRSMTLAAIFLAAAASGASAANITNLYEQALVVGTTLAAAPQYVIYGNNPEGWTCPVNSRCYDPTGASGDTTNPTPVDYGDYMGFTAGQTGFDFLTGLGSITVQVSGAVASDWYIASYFDMEILGGDLDPYGVNPFYNEIATVTGTDTYGYAPSPAGTYLDWQAGLGADADGLRTQLLTASLLSNYNTVGVPMADPALGLAWSLYGLAPDQTVDVTFRTTQVGDKIRFETFLNGGPTMGFAITQADVPEPGSWMLAGIGVLLLAGRKRLSALLARR